VDHTVRLELGAVTSPLKSAQLAARSSGESLTSLSMARPRLGAAIAPRRSRVVVRDIYERRHLRRSIRGREQQTGFGWEKAQK